MVTRKPVSKPQYSAATFARGVKMEAKEHPTLPRKIVRMLVSDHLRKNPKEY